MDKKVSDAALLKRLKKAGYVSAQIMDGMDGKEVRVEEQIRERHCFPLFWRIVEEAGRGRGCGGRRYMLLNDEPI